MPRMPMRVVIYRQIYEKINSGDFKQGERLPSESELCKIFDVSRTVIREALITLEEDGIIETRRGKGRYVVPYSERVSIKLTSNAPFELIFEAEVPNVTFKLRSFFIQEADLYISSILKISRGTPILAAIYLIKVDNDPVAVCNIFIPLDYVKSKSKEDYQKTCALKLLKSMDFTSISRRFTASLLSKEHAKSLQLDRRTPVLLIQQQLFQGNLVIAYSKIYINTDKVFIEFKLNSKGGAWFGTGTVPHKMQER